MNDHAYKLIEILIRYEIFNTINHLLYDIRALLLTWLAYLFIYLCYISSIMKLSFTKLFAN